MVRSEALYGQEWDALARRALEIAEAHDRARERLANRRFAALGASVCSDNGQTGRAVPILVLF